MKKIVIIPLIVAVTALSGCQTIQDQGQKETVGTVAGAVLGGIIGSRMGGGEGRLWATGTGVLLGAWLGNTIGQQMDAQDRAMMESTSEAALEHTSTGTVSTWRNPDTGHSGSVSPTRTFQEADGTYCRDFEQFVTVGDKSERATGTACRQDDGSWEVVKK